MILLSINPVYAEDSQVDFSKIFDNHGLIRLIIDAETGSIRYANKAAIDFYGYPKEKLLKMSIQDINTLDLIQIKKEMEAAFREERNYFVFKHRLANGEIRNVEVHSYPVLEEGKETLYSVVIDITERVLLEQSLERSRRISKYLFLGIFTLFFFLIAVLFLSKEKYKKLANYDSLTRAYSRLFLDKLIEHEKNKSNSNEVILLVVVIDIDKFKSINDNFGHIVGDKVLKKVVEVLKSYIRKDDFVIRYGGDEFLLILQNCDKESSHTIINRVKEKLKNNKEFEFPIEFSYGIQEIYDTQEIYNSIKLADEKMYQSKTGKNLSY